jgi:hypothetical protein
MMGILRFGVAVVKRGELENRNWKMEKWEE